jgi:DNA-binding transcriptional MocR family regulator
MHFAARGCRESAEPVFSGGEGRSRSVSHYNAPMALTDLQFNYPILAEQQEQLSGHIAAAMKDSSKWMELPPYGGYTEHREAAAEWLSRGQEAVPASRVMLAAGGHNAVMASMLVAGLRGRKIATDPITYPGFRMQASWQGSELVTCDGDKHGMKPESLEHAAKQGAAAVYLMPTVHNPMGIVMPMKRRQEICEVAAKHSLTILDDDAYGFCEAKPPSHFATLAPERSYFIQSFTKPYAPAMKLAFVVFPAGQESAMAQALRALSSGASALFAEAAIRLMRSGEMKKLLAKKREEAVVRQRIAASAFDGLKTVAHPTSFHVWIELPETKSSDAIAATLEKEGILVSSSRSYSARDDVKSNGMRVALGAVRDLDALRKGLTRVREVIDSDGIGSM